MGSGDAVCVFGDDSAGAGGIGDYLARTSEEAKNRPLYVVAETCNVLMPQRSLTRAVILGDTMGAEAAGRAMEAVDAELGWGQMP